MWLKKLLVSRKDTESSPTGTVDGGEMVAGPLYGGQSQLFSKKEEKNVHKKKRNSPAERAGESTNKKVFQVL